jgi:hypothetical protein
MKNNVTRRSALKFVAAGVVASGVTACAQTSTKKEHTITKNGSVPVQDKWNITNDRVWLGGEFWANPMEDWRVQNGEAECLSKGGNRSIHSLTHQLTDVKREFEISVSIKRLEQTSKDGGAGIRLGARSDLNEYKSNCFVQGGFDCGVINNKLVLGDKKTQLTSEISNQSVTIHLYGTPQLDAMALRLIAKDTVSNKIIGELTHLVPSEKLLGNVALTSNFSIESVTNNPTPIANQGSRYSFSNWTIQGEAFTVSDEQKFGPILWAMYTLSNSRTNEGYVMKLNAYTGPLGDKDNQTLDLQIKRNNTWISLGNEALNTDGWVSTFRIPNWDEKQDTPYRIVYIEKHKDGSQTPDIWSGNIKANPANTKLRMAALTCQNDIGFPYQPVAENVAKLNPDLVFFSGDQLYESHGGYGYIRTPDERSILNYLRKFYQFGWAFRDVLRNAPTVCLPDDHDVLQGNLWGEGGAKMQNVSKDPGASILGGYIESPRVVNAVHRTSVGHHPDPYDPAPTNGISSYYGDLVYGGVSFAIIADRQWKSGPERINVEVGVTGQDEDPLFINPAFNPPGLELLGKRQEDFLEKWGQDWKGCKLKAVLSQTVFAGIATHQPKPNRYLKYDFDSSGFPALARNKAIDIIRSSMALHICGDTHLGSMTQYGVNQQRDSNWAFCTPAISAGWPRWWLPDVAGIPHANRPDHNLAQTGEYLDTFGNKIYVYAVGNPEVGRSDNRYVHAHEKGSGFGFITFDTEKLTYTMDSYRFMVDATDGKASNQFDGWPVTIHQKENRGENILS